MPTFTPQCAYEDFAPSAPHTLAGPAMKFANGYSWEMDERGNHRIVDPQGVGGRWTWYQGIAVSPNGEFCCLSAYWGNDIPTETLLAITQIARV